MSVVPRLLASAILFVGLVGAASPAEAASKPSAPRKVVAAPLVNGVKVSWKPPKTTGGCAIGGYKIQILQGKKVIATKRAGPGARSRRFGNLVPRAQLKAVVAARNCHRLGFKSARAFAPRKVGPAPVGDTARATYWLPGGLGGVSNIYEIWKLDPLSHSVYAGQRMVYQKIGTLPWALSYSQAFVYRPVNVDTILMTVPQSTTIGPSQHTFKVTYYDTALDELGYVYDGVWTGVMGGCRHPEVQAQIPWLCVS